ncbi:hypothetical protein BaRGS_00025846, partial [Batillaria attramentaria]
YLATNDLITSVPLPQYMPLTGKHYPAVPLADGEGAVSLARPVDDLVGKSHPPPSPSTADPPWSRSSPHYSERPSPHAAPRSSYPDVRDFQRPSSGKDRRYSDAPPRARTRHDRDPHLASAKSSPNLIKTEASEAGSQGAESSYVKPVKSSSDIPNELEKENQSYRKRPSMYEQQMLNKLPLNYGKRPSSGRYGGEEVRGDYQEKSKRYSEDMYTADMKAVTETPSLSSHSLQKYQPDYENVAMLVSGPLGSEKISEIDDIEDGTEGDAPAVPPRPTCLNYREDNHGRFIPTPPVRDPSSLKYIKVNQNHEKYPSWPVTQPSAAGDQAQPINVRAQSWTDHTNTSKEFPSKQRLAYTPGLRPLLEKNSPVAERKGEDSSGKARNSSDPGFKNKIEFVYNRLGQVVQKKKDDGKKFEEFYENSKPGYLPPPVDSDGHSYGDKEYNAPSPPERDVAGVDQQVLSQALGAAVGESQQPQPQERRGQSSHFSTTSQQPSPQHPTAPKRPSFLAMSAHPLSHAQRVDMATSPLASPREVVPSPREHSRGLPLSVYSSPLHGKDSITAQTVVANRQTSKAFIVRQTPYYNTSTQTEVPSGGMKMTDPRSRQCNVEIQVGDMSSQTSPFKEYEEKSIQARMSREFQPSDLDSSHVRHSPAVHSPADDAGGRNYFQYQFEGMQSIQAKYATDEDQAADSNSPGNVFSPLHRVPDDQASIMRKLSEEFYGNKLGMMGDKRHSSASSQEHSPKPIDSSSVSTVYSGTMSQAESYSSVVIHPSESAGPFGRDDFGSQSSIAASNHDLPSIASSSRSSMRDSAPRGRNSLDPSFFLHKSPSRPLQESKKFNSLTSIGLHHHHRENSAPVSGHHSASPQEPAQQSKDSLVVDTSWRQPGSYRTDSSSASEASSPSQPKSSPDTRLSGSTQYSTSSHGDSPSDKMQPISRPVKHHKRMESADSVFSDRGSQRERTAPAKTPSFESVGVQGSSVGTGNSSTSAVLTRKASMKKAYGIYDETEKAMRGAKKDDPGAAESPFKSRSHSQSDSKLLGQIQEVNEGDPLSGQDGRPMPAGDRSRGVRLDSWRDDLEKRTGRMQRTASEQITGGRDRSARIYEPSRPQRIFDGSIDSGVGSEVSSRADGQMTPSEPSQPSSLTYDPGRDTDLRKVQQQAVLNFVQRKMPNACSVEHSPESSLYESIGTPHSPHSPTSESVSDLISKTNENLAKRADSIRRSGSTSSRSSSADYVDMSRQERSRKETEWSRLRSSGSFHYGGSNRSSLCSENTYEDISVFATPTPRGSTQEMPKDSEMQNQASENMDDDRLKAHQLVRTNLGITSSFLTDVLVCWWLTGELESTIHFGQKKPHLLFPDDIVRKFFLNGRSPSPGLANHPRGWWTKVDPAPHFLARKPFFFALLLPLHPEVECLKEENRPRPAVMELTQLWRPARLEDEAGQSNRGPHLHLYVAVTALADPCGLFSGSLGSDDGGLICSFPCPGGLGGGLGTKFATYSGANLRRFVVNVGFLSSVAAPVGSVPTRAGAEKIDLPVFSRCKRRLRTTTAAWLLAGHDRDRLITEPEDARRKLLFGVSGREASDSFGFSCVELGPCACVPAVRSKCFVQDLPIYTLKLIEGNWFGSDTGGWLGRIFVGCK